MNTYTGSPKHVMVMVVYTTKSPRGGLQMITVDYGGVGGGRAIDYVIKLFSKFHQLKPNFKEKVIILLQNISVIKLIGY